MRYQFIIKDAPEAIQVIKQMQLKGYEWGRDYREGAREALARVLSEHMDCYIDRCLDEARQSGHEDRRNGRYSRHLLTELGDVELHIPRTRRVSAVKIVRAYARRTERVDQVILACFALGLSTRKACEALLPILGEKISPATVSRVAKVLDGAVKAFHRRPLKDHYQGVILDGVVLARKTGAGAIRRPVLVALGITRDGRKEIIDFCLSQSESEAAWKEFLTDLYRRGLQGEGTDLITVDGGMGLIAAVREVYYRIPLQRCWAHKMRNITDCVYKKDRDKVKRDLHKIYLADTRVSARKAARRFADKWKDVYPKAVRRLRRDLDDLLAFYTLKDPTWRRWMRTTNAIERRFREVRRRTRPMGVFSDRTSIERILYAVFTYENKKEGVLPLFAVTQNN